MFKLIHKWTDKVKEKATKLYVAAQALKMSEKGQGIVEYALIIAAVAIIAVIVLRGDNGLEGSIKGAFTTAKEKITAASATN